jgi:ABC-2 type transport system permease protein
MRIFRTLWCRELAAYFLSPIAYVTIMFFLFVMGYSFWMMTTIMSQGTVEVSVMSQLFGSIFFWIALLVVIPVMSMRLIAEEKRSGTLETLMTAPVSDVAVVLAKYVGAMSFFIVLWLPTIAYAFILRAFDPMATVDYGPMLSGYLGAFLIGGFYIAIGLFCSACTRNQIVAAIFCFAVICVAFFAGFLPYIASNPVLQRFGEYFSAVNHMLDFSRGMVDTRPLILYVSGMVFMLFATIKVLESRKWK